MTTMDHLVSLHESYHICDRRVHWLNEAVVVFRSGACLTFLNTLSSSQTTEDDNRDTQTRQHAQSVLTIPLPYVLDAYACAPLSATSTHHGRVAVALHGPDTVIQLYSFPHKQLLSTIHIDKAPEHRGRVITALAFTRDHRHLLATSNGPTPLLHYLDLNSNTQVTETTALPSVHSISINPYNPTQVVTYNDKQAVLYTIHMLSAYQPPIIQQQPIVLDTTLYNTIITDAVFVKENELVFSTNIGRLFVAQLTTTQTEAKTARTTTHAAQAAATLAEHLPVTQQELDLLFAAGTAESGAAESNATPKSVQVDPATVRPTITATAAETILPLTGNNLYTGSFKQSSAVPQTLALTRHHLVVGTGDGSLLWLTAGTLAVSHVLRIGSAGIFCIGFNPSYSCLLVVDQTGQMSVLRHVTEHNRYDGVELIQPTAIPSTQIQLPVPSFYQEEIGCYPILCNKNKKQLQCGVVSVLPIKSAAADSAASQSRVITYGNDGILRLWSISPRALLSSFTFRSAISCVTPATDGQVALVGLQSGVVAAVDLSRSTHIRLIYAQRLHTSPVLCLRYNADNTLFGSLSLSKLFFIRAQDFRVIGYVKVAEILNTPNNIEMTEEQKKEAEERKQRLDDEAFFASLINKADQQQEQPAQTEARAGRNDDDDDEDESDDDDEDESDDVFPSTSSAALDQRRLSRERKEERDNDSSLVDLPRSFCWLLVPSSLAGAAYHRVLINSKRQVLLLNAPGENYDPADELLLSHVFLWPVKEAVDVPILQLAPSLQHGRFYATTADKCVTVVEVRGDLVTQLSSHTGHYKPAVAVSEVSPAHGFLASAGVDGMVIIWNACTMQPLASFICSDYGQGGCHRVSMDAEGRYLFCAGYDGSITCWDLTQLHSHPDAANHRPRPSTQHPTQLTISPKVLEALPEQSEPLPNSPTFLAQFSSTQAPPLPAELATQRDVLLQQLETVKTMVAEARTRNATLPPSDQLSWHDTCLDTQRRDILLTQSDATIQQRTQDVISSQLGTELIVEQIRSQCWDSMQVHGQLIRAFHTGEEVHNFPIPLIPEKQIKQLKQLYFLRQMELMEKKWRWIEREREHKEQQQQQQQQQQTEAEAHSPPPNSGVWEDVNFWLHPYCQGADYIVNGEEAQFPYEVMDEERDRDRSVSTASGLKHENNSSNKPPKTSEGKRKDASQTQSSSSTNNSDSRAYVQGNTLTLTVSASPNDPSAAITTITLTCPAFFLYHPLECYTPLRQHIQSILLQAKIYSIQHAYNQQFNAFAELKRNEMLLMNEKMKRIQEIQEELAMDAAEHPVKTYSLSHDEIPENVMKVQEGEEESAKVEGGGQYNQQTHSYVQSSVTSTNSHTNHPNHATAHGTTSTESTLALTMMMNNTLQAKRDLSLLESELTPAPWMVSKPAHEWSEEEKLEMIRFEKKIKMIELEQENRKKTLHIEWMKLNNDINDISKNFDYKCISMQQSKQRHCKEIDIQEWYIQKMHLHQALMQLKWKQSKQYSEYANYMLECDQHIHHTRNTLLQELEHQRVLYEQVWNEWKNGEKQLKKEMQELGENYEWLNKQFKQKQHKALILQQRQQEDDAGGGGAGVRKDSSERNSRVERGSGVSTGANAGNLAGQRKSSVVNGVSLPVGRHRSRASLASLSGGILANLHHRGSSMTMLGMEGLTGLGLPGGTLKGGKKRTSNNNNNGDERNSQIQQQTQAIADDQPLNPYPDLDNIQQHTQQQSHTHTGAHGQTTTTTTVSITPPTPIVPVSLTEFEQCPIDLNPNAWSRFIEKRLYLLEKEQESQFLQYSIAQKQQYLQRLQALILYVQQEYEDSVTQYQALDVFSSALNIPLMLRMNQGFIEINEHQHPLHEYPTSHVSELATVYMLHRSDILDINHEINIRGQAKLSIINDMQNYEKERKNLEWQYEMLALEYEQNLDLTTQLQLLRVTKEMQIRLKNREMELMEKNNAGNNNNDSKEDSNTTRPTTTATTTSPTSASSSSLLDVKNSALIEKQMEFVRANVRQLNIDKQNEMMRIQFKIKRIHSENHHLQATIQQLQKAVNQRKAMNELREASEQEKQWVTHRNRMMIVNRRKLLDVAKLQKEEIYWLRGQVEALRRRTFASFAEVKGVLSTGSGSVNVWNNRYGAEEEKMQLHSYQTGGLRKDKRKQREGQTLSLPPV